MSEKIEYQNEVENSAGVAAQPWLLFKLLKAILNITPSASYRIKNFLVFGNEDKDVAGAVFFSIQNMSETVALQLTLGDLDNIAEIPAGDDTVYTFPNSNNQIHKTYLIRSEDETGSYKLIYQTLETV